MKTIYKPNTDNDSEQPRTTNTENNQTQRSLPRASQSQQKQANPQGQPNQVKRPPKTSQTAATTPTGTAEILSIHINNTQTSTYSTTVSDSNVKALFDSGATLSCISKQCYERTCTREPNQIINATAGPPVIITSASNNELTNLGRCQLCFKLGEETFEYYFQIIKNLKQDLILGLNFQKTFKISQDITDSNDLYLHIRNKIITFSTQSTNKKNYICTQECVQIKPKNRKQFRVKAPRNLKSGELYEIDFNGNGFPEGVIPLTCTFIVGHTKSSFTSISLTKEMKLHGSQEDSTSALS